MEVSASSCGQTPLADTCGVSSSRPVLPSLNPLPSFSQLMSSLSHRMQPQGPMGTSRGEVRRTATQSTSSLPPLSSALPWLDHVSCNAEMNRRIRETQVNKYINKYINMQIHLQVTPDTRHITLLKWKDKERRLYWIFLKMEYNPTREKNS